MNLDIVADGIQQDRTLAAAAEMLPNAIRCTDVFTFVSNILGAAGDQKIRRLRVFAHGNSGLIACGHVAAAPTLETGIEHLRRHSAKYIAVVPTEVRDQRTGSVVQTRWPMLNDQLVERLRPVFDERSYVELHCCNVAAGERGQVLLRKLEQLLCCAVYGSAATQVLGGGLEGTVLRGSQNQCQCIDHETFADH